MHTLDIILCLYTISVLSPSASQFLYAGNLHQRGKVSSCLRRLLFFIGAAPNLASASPTVIFCLFSVVVCHNNDSIQKLPLISQYKITSTICKYPYSNIFCPFVIFYFHPSLTKWWWWFASCFFHCEQRQGLWGTGCRGGGIHSWMAVQFIIALLGGVCGFSVEMWCGFYSLPNRF